MNAQPENERTSQENVDDSITKKHNTRNRITEERQTTSKNNQKLTKNILAKRLRTVKEQQINEAQRGFRKGQSAQDLIFSIKELILKTLLKNMKIYLAFVDLEQPVDRVSQNLVWISLKERNAKQKLTDGIQSL